MIRLGLMVAVAMSFAGSAEAATFYGYTAVPNGVVSGDAKAAHDAFVGSLITSSVEDFESFAVGQALPLALSFEEAPARLVEPSRVRVPFARRSAACSHFTLARALRNR
jgi:hypothetical protein